MSGWSKDYKEKFEYAVELYKSGKQPKEISMLLKMDCEVLRKNLRFYGFQVKDLNINEHIWNESFSKIETEEQAYWLGMMYADGYVSKDSNRIELTLKDKEHVEKFAKFLNLEKTRVKPKTAMGKTYFKLSFRNFTIHKDLINNGCIPQKSLYLSFPKEKILPKNLINHFVRGYFDGDGSLGIYSNKGEKPTPQISINGTLDFLEEVSNIYSLPKNKYGKDGNAFRYSTTNKDAVKFFLTSVYGNSSIHLDRKYKLFVSCRFE
jgi:hypothetical protein